MPTLPNPPTSKRKENNLIFFSFFICLFTVLCYSKVFNQGALPHGPPPCRGPLPRASESSQIRHLVNPSAITPPPLTFVSKLRFWKGAQKQESKDQAKVKAKLQHEQKRWEKWTKSQKWKSTMRAPPSWIHQKNEKTKKGEKWKCEKIKEKQKSKGIASPHSASTLILEHHIPPPR